MMHAKTEFLANRPNVNDPHECTYKGSDIISLCDSLKFKASFGII